MTTTPTAIFTITVTILVVLTTTTSAYAGGPRLDWPEDSSDEGKDCWVEGYDAGFAQKYDKERINVLKKMMNTTDLGAMHVLTQASQK
jgi:hypothetical protein